MVPREDMTSYYPGWLEYFVMMGIALADVGIKVVA